MTHSYIAVLNKSSLISDADCHLMTYAVAHQLRMHAAPAWQQIAPAVVFHKQDPPPPGHWPLYILDDPDTAGALGYHDEDPAGNPYGRIFVKPTLANGGAVLTNPTGGPTVSSVLSHEALEALIDPYVQLWADRDASSEVAYEVGDPVEAISYAVTVQPTGQPATLVQVSDFVLPRWFDAKAPAGTQLSFCNSVHTPFAQAKGGYLIVRTSGQVTQEYGAEYPAWKLDLKGAGSRTARRQHLCQ